MVEIESLLIKWLKFLRQYPKITQAMTEMFPKKNANFQLPNLETKFFLVAHCGEQNWQLQKKIHLV